MKCTNITQVRKILIQQDIKTTCTVEKNDTGNFGQCGIYIGKFYLTEGWDKYKFQN